MPSFFQMFLFTYAHPRMAGPKEKAAAMNRIKGILREANFSGHAFPFSKEYGSWETDLVRYVVLCLQLQKVSLPSESAQQS